MNDPSQANRTLQQSYRAYLTRLRSLNYSHKTLAEYSYTLRRLVAWLERTCKLTAPAQLRKTHFEAWHRHVREFKTAKGYPIKPPTVNKHLAVTRSYLYYLAATGIVPKSLVDALPLVKEPVMLPGSTLPHAQVRRVLRKQETRTPEGYRMRTILELLYTSGIRARELLGLDVADIDLEYGTARVLGKGSKERMVPLGRTAHRYLETYIKAIRPFLVRDRGETALFLNARGARYSYSSLQIYIQRFMQQFHFDERVTAHTFRRSCATEMIRSGANVYHVKELLGHETLRTLNHYLKLTIADLKKTHERTHPRERDERS